MLTGAYQRYRHWLLLLFYPFVGAGFVYCETTVTSATYWLRWPEVDGALPFLPFMVVPYLFWYPLVAFPFAWLGRTQPREFRQYCWFIYGAMTSTYALYLLFPNGQALRPVIAGTDWAQQCVRWIYSQDTPLNVCPSLHVIDTMGVWFALGRNALWNRRRWRTWLLSVACLAVIVSTVTIKQHSVIDVLAGVVWSALWYGLIYGSQFPTFRFWKK